MKEDFLNTKLEWKTFYNIFIKTRGGDKAFYYIYGIFIKHLAGEKILNTRLE